MKPGRIRRAGPIGRPLPRVEDTALLTGEARFVADIAIADAAEAVFVRSIYAHGDLRGVDLSEARAMPGVLGAWAAHDLPGLPGMPATPGAAPLPEAMARPSLARERVRFVGEPVAVVVAEDLARAQDAAEAVLVDVDPLPAVLDPTLAASHDAVALFPGHPNVASDDVHGDDATLAMGLAAVVVEMELRQQRVAPVSIETRRILVVPEPEDRLTAWCSHQAPHRLRGMLADAFGLAPERVRVIAPEVGGAFGAKSQTWPEYLVIADLARRLGRPVRWIEGRSESFLAGPHGRGQNQRIRLGGDPEGRILALEVEIDADVGAYPHTGALVATNTAWLMSGPYRIPSLTVRVRAVTTNAPPTAPYRGAGRPEAAFALERVVDEMARRLRLDPAEVRRRNFIPRAAFPYDSPTGARYDSADHAAALAAALEAVGYDALRDDQRRRGEELPLLGIGIGCYVERSGGAAGSSEFGSVEVDSDGRIVARTGSSSQGQGHRTAFAQVVADVLDVDPSGVLIVQGDTALVPDGTGTFASRSMQVGGASLYLAAREVLDVARRAAADELEVSPEDLLHRGGAFEVAGSPDRRRSLGEIAEALDGISVVHRYTSPQAFPFGTYVAIVEIERETGDIALRRIVAVDDCGTVINPLLAEGQIIGSTMQGIGQALYESMVYDEGGEPLTTSLASYPIPTTSEIVPTTLRTMETPTPDGPLGAKGIGESGCIGAPPAIVNAVVDALRDYDTAGLEMPVTPEQVWRILRAGTRDADLPDVTRS